MSRDALDKIPTVDFEARPRWKRNLNWLSGGQLATTETGLALWRKR